MGWWWLGGLFEYSVKPGPYLSRFRLGLVRLSGGVGRWWRGGLFEYSVKPGPYLSRFRLGLVRLVTRSTKARFGQVGDQVSKVKARARSLTTFIIGTYCCVWYLDPGLQKLFLAK